MSFSYYLKTPFSYIFKGRSSIFMKFVSLESLFNCLLDDSKILNLSKLKRYLLLWHVTYSAVCTHLPHWASCNLLKTLITIYTISSYSGMKSSFRRDNRIKCIGSGLYMSVQTNTIPREGTWWYTRYGISYSKFILPPPCLWIP